MYIKNISNDCVGILSTVQGKIAIKPENVIKVDCDVYEPFVSCLKLATEEEFNTFNGIEPIKVEKTIPPTNNETTVAEKSVTDEPNIDVETEEAVTDEQKKGILDMMKGLLIVNAQNPQLIEEAIKQEKLIEKQTKEQLVVEETDSKEEIEKLEAQVENLKQTWQQTKQAAKKAKIAKQIKEVEKQIEKLK